MILGETGLDEGVATLEQQKAILAEMMMVDADGKLQYSPDITGGSVVQNMHKPLAELNFLLTSGWSIINPPGQDFIREIWQQPKFQFQPEIAGRKDVCQIEGFDSSPVGLFAGLEILSREELGFAKEIDLFRKDLKRMKEVLLLGAISPHAIYGTATFLEQMGFRGNLVATDLSPIPINLTRKLHRHFPFVKNLSLELTITDATTDIDDQLGKKRFGLVITDILGYYLSPQQYSWATTNIDTITTSRGYLATRELTEPSNPESGRKKSVGITDDAEQNFLTKIKQFFPQANYSLDEVKEFFANMWPKNTVSRKDPFEYVGENAMNSKLVAHICTAPSKESVRVFETFLYKKRSVRFF